MAEQQLALMRPAQPARQVKVLTAEEAAAEALATDLLRLAQRHGLAADDPRLAAFAMLCGLAVAGPEAPAPRRGLSETERARWWPRAWDEWLARDQRKGLRTRAEKTMAAYRAAWEDFRLFIGSRCQEWRVTGREVQEWLEELRSRSLAERVAKGLVAAGRREEGQAGYSESTVAQYLAAISSFYSFAERYAVALEDGRRERLFEGPNPCQEQCVVRPVVSPYDKCGDFDDAQVRALLNAIERDRKRHPITATRNMALFLGYLLTGARNAEIRELRWGDIRVRGRSATYHWNNKGKEQVDELPAPVWWWLREYLKLAGRLETIKPEDYVFVAHSECWRRLGTGAKGGGPLSENEVNRLLRRYCVLAEIDPKGVHVHMLRHTAGLTMVEVAEGRLNEVQVQMHHSNLATTTIYVSKRQGVKNPFWNRLAERWKVWWEEEGVKG